MAKWTRRTYKFDGKLDNFGKWKCKPGNVIFVAGRGDVQFEVPREWIIKPTETLSVRFYDKEPPADDCVIELSVNRLPIEEVDWTGLPLTSLLAEATKDSTFETMWQGDVQQIKRGDLEIAWFENHHVDPVEHREAIGLALLARRANVIPFITFDYWPEDAKRCGKVWRDLLDSLKVATEVKNPRRN
jgi:hypothetical protein